jgi:hypothetical protein
MSAECGGHRAAAWRGPRNQKEGITMGIALSMLMIAAGAIMRFAVTAEGSGFNVHTTGVVLMVVGAIGVVLSMIYWASWGGFGHRAGGPGGDRPREVH